MTRAQNIQKEKQNTKKHSDTHQTQLCIPRKHVSPHILGGTEDLILVQTIVTNTVFEF